MAPHPSDTAAAQDAPRCAPLPARLVDRAARYLPWVLPALASGFVVWMGLPFLEGAQSRAWDDLFHQSLTELVADAIANGQNPFGVLPSHLGIPALRFYQSLHYLVGAVIHVGTGVPITILQNWMIVVFFAASPWAYRHFYRTIGLGQIAASVGALLTVGSINGLANSFEGYYELGVTTQAGAALLMPLALAAFVRLIRDGRGMIATGTLMGLTFLTHPMFAVYAAIAAGLIIVIFVPRQGRIWLRIAGAALLAGILAAGWLVPFLQQQYDKRPIPEIVARPDREIWFAGFSPKELATSIATGRLLDGGRLDNSDADRLETRLNMTNTREKRAPYYTVLVLLGLLVGLLGCRERSNRLLVAGFSFGILLLLGTDDLPWLFALPLFNKVQAFRVTPFVELFAFGLAGAGLEWVGRRFLKLGDRIGPARIFTAILIIGGGISVCAHVVSMKAVISPLLDTWEKGAFDPYINLLKRDGKSAKKQRTIVKFEHPGRQFRFATEHALEVLGGFRTACNHWTGLSSTIDLTACGMIGQPWSYPTLSRMMGVRYMLIDRDRVEALAGESAPNASEYKRIGRVGRVHLLEDKRAGALHELPGPRILVIADATQWYWLSNRWLSSFARRIGDATTPILIRGRPESLKDDGVVSAVDAVYHLDGESLADDLDSLKRIAASSKRILLTHAVPGLESETLDGRTVDWKRLMEGIERPARVTAIKRTDRAKTPERFTFDVSASAPSLVMLAMHHFSNWNAAVDGSRTPVFAAGPDAVAALVPAGEHELVFTFEQTAVERATGWITAAGWLFVVLVGAWTIAQRVRRRKSAKRESAS